MSKIVERHIPCPKCPSSDGYCIWDDGHGYCYSCNYYKKKDFEIEENSTTYTYEYLPWRGISKETMQAYDAKTKVDAQGKPISIGFKYSNGSHKIRLLESKDFYSQGEISKAGLFGKDKFSQGGAKYITITEGEVDALSLFQVLGSKYPVVSVQSASCARRDCSVDHQYLDSFDRIYLAFDNDGPGKEAAREVASLFDFNKVYHVRLSRYKDANEYLTRGASDELLRVWWNSKKYLPEGIISSLAEFQEIVKERPTKGIDYPFPTLNEMTYGLRRGESVLFTAQEGIGKTELMHAIEYKLLKETTDAIGAIFLEEPKHRHLQALAGLELRQPVHLPDVGCSETEVAAALERVLGHDERLHLYSHFGSDDPDTVLGTIRFMASVCKCSFILLDHISMVVSGLQGDDERKALDYLSTRLAMMVKELDFGLIFVSHVNDDGYTRGSRYISKIADIRVDATRDVRNPDERERNTTSLVVSKNRFSGRTGPAGRIYFDPKTYTMEEEVPNALPV